jgi:hypothetical protein
MPSTGFNVPYSYMSRKYSNHFHPHLSSPSRYYPPPNMICFTFLSFIWSVQCSVRFCSGISPVSILYFNQSNPLYYSIITLFSTIFSVFHCVLFLHR